MNDRLDELRQQYGCGPVQFSGADEALYNRHLLFDDVIDPFKATPREQFEAMATVSARRHFAALAADREDV